MNLYDAALRKWFPRRFIKRRMHHIAIEHKKQMQKAKTKYERRELIDLHNEDMCQWGLWLRSIEDADAVKRAAKMDIALDDIPLPDCEPDEKPGHWTDDEFGNRCLASDTRRALHKAMRERAANFRKERRETIDLYLKISLATGSAVAGIGGTLIGLLSILKK